MTALKDITGQKFGRLTALYRLHNYSKKRVHYLCICECGNFTETASNNLINGKIKSCGCLRGKNHHKCDTRLYRIYYNMKNRCYNKNISQYKDWGGRGITLCDEWCEILNLNYGNVLSRIYKLNWSIDEALELKERRK